MNIKFFSFIQKCVGSPVKKILTRMSKLKEEITIFLREYQSNFLDKFEDEVFIISLSYLADIFSHFNDLNMFMQGMYAYHILCTEKI